MTILLNGHSAWVLGGQLHKLCGGSGMNAKLVDDRYGLSKLAHPHNPRFKSRWRTTTVQSEANRVCKSSAIATER